MTFSVPSPLLCSYIIFEMWWHYSTGSFILNSLPNYPEHGICPFITATLLNCPQKCQDSFLNQFRSRKCLCEVLLVLYQSKSSGIIFIERYLPFETHLEIILEVFAIHFKNCITLTNLMTSVNWNILPLNPDCLLIN